MNTIFDQKSVANRPKQCFLSQKDAYYLLITLLCMQSKKFFFGVQKYRLDIDLCFSSSRLPSVLIECYLFQRRAVKALVRLGKCAVLKEPSLLMHTKKGSI